MVRTDYLQLFSRGMVGIFCIALLVSLVVLLINRRTRTWATGISIGALVLMVFLFFGFRFIFVMRGGGEYKIPVAEVRKLHDSERDITARKIANRRKNLEAEVARNRAAQETAQKTEHKHDRVGHEEQSDDPADDHSAAPVETTPTTVATESDKSSDTKPEKNGRPDWVDKQPYQDGDTYVWPVVSDSQLVGQDTESSLRRNAEKVVREFIDVRLLRDEEAVLHLSNSNELRKLMLKEILAPDRYLEPMVRGQFGKYVPKEEWDRKTSHSESRDSKDYYRRHAVLRFTPEVNRELERRWQQHPSNPVNRVAASEARSAEVVHVPAEYTMAWNLIILLAIILFVGWLIINRHARTPMMKQLPVAVVIILVVFGYWMIRAEKMENQRRGAMQSRLRSIGQSFNGEAAKVSSPEKSSDAKVPIDAAKPDAAALSGDRATTSAPTWLNDPPQKRGEAYYVVVRSGEVSDVAMREESLDVKMVAASQRYIDEMLYRDSDVSRAAKIDAPYLRDHCVAAEYTSTETGSEETFVQLKFDQRFRDEVKSRFRQHVSTSRVEQLGSISLGVLGVLAAALAFLRFTKPRVENVKRGD
jgi:hypothetical protein